MVHRGREGPAQGGVGTKATGRISFYGRASEAVSETGLHLRGIGSRLRVGLQRPANSEADEIALHLGRRFNPRLLLLLLAGCAAGLGLLDLLQSHGFGYSLRLFDLTDSDIRSKLSFSATATSALLFAAAWLAFALDGVDPRRARARWGLAGAVFLAYAIEELFGFQHWLEGAWAPHIAAYLLVVVLTASAWAGGLYTLRTRPRGQLAFGLAMVGWLGAFIADGSRAPGVHDAALPELIEFIAAGLFCIALLARLQYIARRTDPLEQIAAPEVSRAASQLVARVNLERLTIVLGALIAGFALQDILLHTGNYHGHVAPVLDVNTEQTIPATFSALLLVGAGSLAMLAATMVAMPRKDRPWWSWFGLVMMALALEEVAAIHDTFQDVTGLPGQIILLPLAIGGIVVWCKLLPRTAKRPDVRALLIAGAAVWLVSQVSDLLLNPIMRWTIVPEEAAEMVGSTLWLLAAALLVRQLLAEGDDMLAARDEQAGLHIREEAAQGLEPRFPGPEPDLYGSAQVDTTS